MIDADELKLTVELSEFIERDLGPPKRKHGRNFFWLCPLHEDRKTPSLHVTDDNGQWYCYGCGKGGDIFSWCEAYHKDTFKDALRRIEGYAPPSPVERREMAIERAERAERELEAKIEEAKEALALLREERRWMQYHNQMDEKSQQYWRKRGVPEFWQKNWALGWNHKMGISTPQGMWTTPTATIPIFDQGGDVLNIKHRLIHPPESAGKYRYELSGQGAPLYLTDPDAELTGHVVIVEGEIKAMVTYIALDDPGTPVVGLPGATPPKDALQPVLDASRVTLVMDPGADEQARDLAKLFGRGRCRLLIPSMKIDDAIIEANLSKREVQMMLSYAVPV